VPGIAQVGKLRIRHLHFSTLRTNPVRKFLGAAVAALNRRDCLHYFVEVAPFLAAVRKFSFR